MRIEVNGYRKIEMESKGMERCYIFRTYFYSKLVESTDTSSSSYQKWTKVWGGLLCVTIEMELCFRM